MLALALVAVSNADVNGFLLAVQLHIGGERGILLLLGAYHGQVCAGLDVAVDHVSSGTLATMSPSATTT